MRIETTVAFLAFLVLAVLTNLAISSPQLTFSTDWSGGRRETGNDDFDIESNSDCINKQNF